MWCATCATRRALLAVVHDPPHRARARRWGAAGADGVDALGVAVGNESPRERARVVARGGDDHREERHEEARGRAAGGSSVRIPAGYPRGLVERRERVERVPGDATRAVVVAGCEIRLGDLAKRERELAQGGNHARHVLAGHHGALSRTAAVGPRGRQGTRRVG